MRRSAYAINMFLALLSLCFNVRLHSEILIQQPIYQDPYILKLTRSVTQEYLNVHLFHTPQSAATLIITPNGGDTTIVLFVAYAAWNRIVYGVMGG